MDLHKKIRKGSIVYYKNYIDGKILFEVEDVFINLDGLLMICLVRINNHNSILPSSEYYDYKRFDVLFEFSIVDILKKL